MRRREFITGGGAAVILPIVLHAQNRIPRVAVLTGFADNDPEGAGRLAAFREGLESWGWFQGRNLQLDIRNAPLGTRANEHANELVALQPDAMFAASTPMAAALQRTTRLLPI